MLKRMRHVVLVFTCFGASLMAGQDSGKKRNCSWSILSFVGELLGLDVADRSLPQPNSPVLAEPKEKALKPDSRVNSPVTDIERTIGFHQGVRDDAVPSAPRSTENSTERRFLEPQREIPAPPVVPVGPSPLVKKIMEHISPEHPDRSYWLDYLNYSYLRSITSEKYVVGLLYGNPNAKLAVKSGEATNAYLSLVTRLKKEQRIVFYDADSKLAPFLASELGERGIGISGGETNFVPDEHRSRVIVIRNPYLRMSAWQRAETLVMNGNSITGMGLLFSERSVNLVVDPEGVFSLNLPRWAGRITPDLGLKYSKKPQIIRSGDDIKLGYGANASPIERPQYEKLAAKWDLRDFETRASEIDCIKKGIAQMSVDPESGQGIPGGMALLGSSRNHSDFTSLVYGSGRYLGSRGVPLVTGGSGGFMEVGNAGAYSAGGYSIGVPMGGLFRERSVASRYHTHTVPSMNYETRVPLLIHDRAALVFAPGGDGTTRELATGLVAAGASANGGFDFVFLSRSYYGEMYQSLLSTLHGTAFERQVHLVDRVEEWPTVMHQIEQRLGDNVGKLRTQVVPQARDTNTEFPKEEIPSRGLFSRMSDDDSWLLD